MPLVAELVLGDLLTLIEACDDAAHWRRQRREPKLYASGAVTRLGQIDQPSFGDRAPAGCLIQGPEPFPVCLLDDADDGFKLQGLVAKDTILAVQHPVLQRVGPFHGLRSSEIDRVQG